MEASIETQVILTEAYAKRGSRPGLYKFVFHAPSKSVIIGVGEESHNKLYQSLKGMLKFPKRKSDFVVRGVFNRNDNRVWLVKKSGPESEEYLPKLARALAKEGIGHFDVHLAGGMKPIGKLSEIASRGPFVSVVKVLGYDEMRSSGSRNNFNFIFHAPSKTLVVGGQTDIHGQLFNKFSELPVEKREGDVFLQGYVDQKAEVVHLYGNELPVNKHVLDVAKAMTKEGFGEFYLHASETFGPATLRLLGKVSELARKTEK